MSSSELKLEESCHAKAMEDVFAGSLQVRKHFHLKTTQLLFEVVLSVEGFAQEPLAWIARRKRDRPLGEKPHGKAMRKNITLEVEGGADMFVCEFLCELYKEGLRKVRTSGTRRSLDVTSKSCGRLMSSCSVLIESL